MDRKSILILAASAVLLIPNMVGAQEDDSLTLKGDEESTVLRSLTIEGEDRIQIEFDRPALL